MQAPLNTLKARKRVMFADAVGFFGPSGAEIEPNDNLKDNRVYFSRIKTANQQHQVRNTQLSEILKFQIDKGLNFISESDLLSKTGIPLDKIVGTYTSLGSDMYEFSRSSFMVVPSRGTSADAMSRAETPMMQGNTTNTSDVLTNVRNNLEPIREETQVELVVSEKKTEVNPQVELEVSQEKLEKHPQVELEVSQENSETEHQVELEVSQENSETQHQVELEVSQENSETQHQLVLEVSQENSETQHQIALEVSKKEKQVDTVKRNVQKTSKNKETTSIEKSRKKDSSSKSKRNIMPFADDNMQPNAYPASTYVIASCEEEAVQGMQNECAQSVAMMTDYCFARLYMNQNKTFSIPNMETILKSVIQSNLPHESKENFAKQLAYIVAMIYYKNFRVERYASHNKNTMHSQYITRFIQVLIHDLLMTEIKPAIFLYMKK